MIPPLARSDEDRVVAGVCAAIGRELGVDATLVRLVFALLALAGGAGIILYFALWAHAAGRTRLAAILVVLAGIGVLSAAGLSARSVAAIAMIAAGLALIWRRGGSLRRDARVSIPGLAVALAGVVLLLVGGAEPLAVFSPGAVAAALLLVVGPWLWRLVLERDAERTARIRTEERAEVAARVHDSVLQTLALIQRHSGDARRVATLARRQERELRGWLYGDGAARGDSLVAALAATAEEIEELHGVRVELASSGDCPATEDVRPVVLAAREAMANAAKFSGADEVDVFADVDGERVSVFVRDRGVGFERTAATSGRGIAESIEGRMTRAGGVATVTSAPGEGTEVELTLPRGAT